MFRRDRSLQETSRKLNKKDPSILESLITEHLRRHDELRVLEVGFGQGRTLLELAARFRNDPVRFFGVDKTCEPPVECREDLRETARRFDLLPSSDLDELVLPEILFQDARRLDFPDESIDVIYSAVTVRHMEHKAEFLEEVVRVLAAGGVALLHIGESNWNYPFGPALDPPRLTSHLNRFVLRHEHELIPLPAYLRLFEDDGLRFEWVERSRCVLKVIKAGPARLDLGLTYDPDLSMPMRELGYVTEQGKLKGGFRSVYRVSDARYRDIFDRGLLETGPPHDA
jgi:SAM-dependent methyltransferase